MSEQHPNPITVRNHDLNQHFNECSAAERCLLKEVTIIGPIHSDINQHNFHVMSEEYKRHVGRSLSNSEVKTVTKWLKDGSPMLSRQVEKRRKMLLGYLNETKQYEHESFPTVQKIEFMIREIEREVNSVIN